MCVRAFCAMPCIYKFLTGGGNRMRRSLNEVIKLNEKQKKQLADEIRAFYLDVRGEEIGIIEERQVMDLFCQHWRLLFTIRHWTML